MINNGNKIYKDNNYLEELKTIVTDLNNLLSGVMDKVTFSNFNGFLGKMMPKDVKREVYDLIYANEGVYIFKVDYYTTVILDGGEAEDTATETEEQGNI